MKKVYLLSYFLTGFSSLFLAQSGYDIKFNLKNNKDKKMYLARYYFEQTGIIDSCTSIKNGIVEFKGATDLDKGVYILATEQKGRLIDFMVDDSQKFTVSGDMSDLINSMKSTSKENEQLFSYAKFMTEKDKEYKKVVQETAGKSKDDSIKFVTEKAKLLSDDVKKFDADFMQRNKGTFVYDFMNLRTEKYATDAPTAKNGRPDSTYQYNYYKNHYFDGVNFKDDRIMYTPFFGDKLKRYFDQVIVQHPDTVIKEMDKILRQCVEGSSMFNTLVGHFAYKYETSKGMSFDQYGNSFTMEKAFVHVAKTYIATGKTHGYYSDETVEKIKERIKILEPLLPGSKVPDLYVIDTTDGRKVLKMGFDTARSSAGVTELYNKNADKLNGMFKTLYQVNAKYTILVFWAADCGHCKTEIPKLAEDIKSLKGKVDFKVFAVQTKEELYDEWKQFIDDKKLSDFINVFDPVHINNTREKFDINATPVIYLLDKDKKIIGKKLAPEQAVDIIRKFEHIEAPPAEDTPKK